MFCQKCGAKNEEDSKFCVSCGEPFAVSDSSKNEIHIPANVDLQVAKDKIREQFNSAKQEISGVKSAGDAKKLILGSRRIQIMLGVISLVIIISIILVVRACTSSGVDYYTKWKNVDYSELDYVQSVTGVPTPQAYAIINRLYEDKSTIDYIEEYPFENPGLLSDEDFNNLMEGMEGYLIECRGYKFYKLTLWSDTKNVRTLQRTYIDYEIEWELP